ncbi:unnamed protein product [Boreogadus saida]
MMEVMNGVKVKWAKQVLSLANELQEESLSVIVQNLPCVVRSPAFLSLLRQEQVTREPALLKKLCAAVREGVDVENCCSLFSAVDALQEGELGPPTEEEQGPPTEEEQGPPTEEEQGPPIEEEQGPPTEEELGPPTAELEVPAPTTDCARIHPGSDPFRPTETSDPPEGHEGVRLSPRPSVPTAVCPHGRLSPRPSVPTAVCPHGRLSPRPSVQR